MSLIINGYKYLGLNHFKQPVWLELATGKRIFGNLFTPEEIEEEKEQMFNRYCLDQKRK